LKGRKKEKIEPTERGSDCHFGGKQQLSSSGALSRKGNYSYLELGGEEGKEIVEGGGA